MLLQKDVVNLHLLVESARCFLPHILLKLVKGILLWIFLSTFAQKIYLLCTEKSCYSLSAPFYCMDASIGQIQQNWPR